MHWEKLKEIGKDWRSQFHTIEFLGEIDVDPATIEEVCQVIGGHLGSATDDEDFCAALAVTVVNLAYDIEEEAAPPSFRNHVLRKFGQATDTTIWENSIGHPVEKILEHYFHEPPTSGPFRFVTPILRQAGVSARSLGQFSIFFRDLIQRYGWQFSKEQFDGFLASQNHHGRLQEFLKTETGWRFCLDLARVLLHRQRGLVNQETLRLLPGFRGGILERLWESIHMTPTRNRPIPLPRLILDTDKRKLAIEFAEKGLNSGYFWPDGRRIRLGRYYLEEDDFHRDLCVKINQPDARKEYHMITPWHPDRRPWAVFHHTNGAYQNTASPHSGRHLLALPEIIELPAEVQVHEEIGELYLPGWHGQTIRIIDCELPPDLTLSNIKLEISGSPSAFPSLSFGRSPSSWPNAHHVFSGRLPEIVIANWRPDFAQRFWVVMDDGSDEKLCDQSLFHNAASFRCPVSPPSQGRIRIEPSGRTPQGFVRAELSFVLLPSGTHLKWPEQLLQSNDEAIIKAHPPENFQIEWLQDEIESIAVGCWRVPQNLDFVEGQVSHIDGISFPVAGHIYRLTLNSTAIKGSVLWDSEIKRRAPIQIRLSPAEVSQRIEFGILTEKRLFNALLLPPVPAHGSLDLTTDDVRDALEDFFQPAGMLAVRLSNGRTLSTGIVYASEQKVLRCLWVEDLLGKDDWERNLPEPLRRGIRLIRQLRAAPLDQLVLSIDHLPESLRDFFDFIELCWKVFDKDLRKEPPDRVKNENWRALLIWFNEARGLIGNGVRLNPQTVEQMLRRMPDATSLLPFARWRQAYNRTADELRGIEDWTNTVKHWRLLCHNEQWVQARESRIGNLPGGKTLTDAANHYFYALERKLIEQPQAARNWFVSAKQKFEQAGSESEQGIVLEIATALRTMIFYHLCHSSFRAEAEASIARLPDEWQRLKCILRQLQGQNFPTSCAGTLGLTDISPHDEDSNLENSTHEPGNNWTEAGVRDRA